MKSFLVTLAASVLAAAMGSIGPVRSSENTLKPTQAAGNLTSEHDFDFLAGEWRVHHRVGRPADSQEWLEFDCASQEDGN